MKKRSGIVFALCAVLGAAGFMACSDDSGKSSDVPAVALKADPTSISFYKGDSKTINLTGTPSVNVKIENNGPECISVGDKVTLDSTGSASVNVAAVGDNCAATLSIKDDSSTATVSVTVLSEDAPAFNVTPMQISMNSGEKQNISATYKDKAGAAHEGNIKAVSTDPNCVYVQNLFAFENGEATIEIEAKGSECSANINLTGPANELASVQVTVAKDDEELPPVEGDNVIEFDQDTLTIAYADGSGQYTLRYSDDKGNMLGDKKLNVSIGPDNSCVKLDGGKKITTKADGSYTGSITVVSADCTAELTATDGKAVAKLPITVTSQTEYDVKVAAKYDSPKYDTIESVSVYLGNGSCDNITVDTIQAFAKGNDAEEERGVDGIEPLLTTFSLEEVSVNVPTVIVTASASASGPVTAFGCSPISIANQNDTVTVDMQAVPPSIIGNYEVVSNIDISSAFTKQAHDKLVYVEEMNAGDWVNFVVNFFDKPLDTLLDFIWVNSLDRLAMIKNDKGEQVIPDFVINVLLGDTGKALVHDNVMPLLKNYLDEQGWYKIITTISPDIKDLVTNMQFYGTPALQGGIHVTKTKDGGLTVEAADQIYSYLQYQLSLKGKDGASFNCDANAYGKEGSCRVNMKLKDKHLDGTITGNWTGKISYDDIKGDILTIEPHNLEFKWATILYAAVFGEILPKALGYDQTESVKNGLYIKAFLEKVLFDTIVKVYEDGRAEYNSKNGCQCDSSGACKNPDDDSVACRSVIKNTASCERFIEALVYLIYPNASTQISLITMAAGYACGEQGIGQLETLVGKSLAKVQAGTFKIQSKDPCSLYDEGTIEYQHFGIKDAQAHTAYDVFKAGSKIESTRCTWDFNLNETFDAYGLFHAYRTK